MKKYDFVKVKELKELNKYYGKAGEHFIGAKAMVIGVDDIRGDDYTIELCFFNQELQELAMEEGFDYWKREELELM